MKNWVVKNWIVKFRQYEYYRWVYIIGTVLTFVNCTFVQNVYVTRLSLLVLYGILSYKGIHILMRYRKIENKFEKADKVAFGETYHPFRFRVAMFWLAFVVLCVLGKFVVKIDHRYFYCCTYFFLLLDRLFVNVGCLLRKFSDPKGDMVICCCGCPCRGWDLMMIHTPLLFALHQQGMMENTCICLSSVIAMISMVCWEKQKYSLVEVRKKCIKACNLTLCRENKQ